MAWVEINSSLWPKQTPGKWSCTAGQRFSIRENSRVEWPRDCEESVLVQPLELVEVRRLCMGFACCPSLCGDRSRLLWSLASDMHCWHGFAQTPRFMGHCPRHGHQDGPACIREHSLPLGSNDSTGAEGGSVSDSNTIPFLLFSFFPFLLVVKKDVLHYDTNSFENKYVK